MNHPKIVHKRHTGKVVHHRHTSYGWLLAFILFTAAPLIIASRTAVLAAGDPVEASESVYAVVSAPVPSVAPVINVPLPGSTFNNSDLVTVSGTCTGDVLLKVFKNDILAGAVFCQGGQFSLQVNLFAGVNSLIVVPFNANDIPGPGSNAVAVTNTVSGMENIQIASTATQFFITSDIKYRGIKVGDKLSWPVTLNGGQAPYAVSIGWGDGEVDLLSKSAAGTFSIEHIFEKPGNSDKSSHNVTLTATDQLGNKSFMQLVAIVSGEQPTLAGSIKQGFDISGYIQAAWQVSALAIIIIVSFLLGERRELRLIRKQAKTV